MLRTCSGKIYRISHCKSHCPATILNLFQQFWLYSVGVDLLSVVGYLNRTNNQTEAWHRQLNQKMMTASQNLDVCL